MAARKRIDPKSRPADGLVPYDEFDNLDPEREYVVAEPNDRFTGVSVYQARGWEVENNRPDGPRARAGAVAKDGEAVQSCLGGYLMSRPKEFGRREFLAGQARADLMERRLRGGNLDGEARGSTHRVGVDTDPRFHSAEASLELEGA